jgi:hypothetical protein
MKKVTTLLIALIVSTSSIQVMAQGGGGGSRGGSPSLTKEQLEKHWNGKAGPQSTPIAGILAHWTADVCGTLNGQVSDESKCPTNSPKMSQEASK